jgi:hypothetical protein
MAWTAAISTIIGVVAASAIGIVTWWPGNPGLVNPTTSGRTAAQPVAQGNRAEVRQLERAVMNGFSTLENEVADLDRATFYLHQGGDTWQRELESVQRDLSEVESFNN